MLLQNIGNRKVHIRFSFGTHQEKNDFIKAKEAADSFKPHIYSPEASDMTKLMRAKQVVELNRGLDKARKDPGVRKLVLDSMDALSNGGFQRAQLAYVIDSPDRPFYYPLEAHDTLFHDDAVSTFYSLQNVSLHAASIGDLNGAIRIMAESFKVFAASNLRREAGIIENIQTYASEAISIFPKLANSGLIRVFARFGTTHAGIFERAQSAFNDEPGLILSKIEDFADGSRNFLSFDLLQLELKAKDSPSDELVVRTILEFVLMERYRQDYAQGRKLDHSKDPLIFNVSRALTVAQIQELFKLDALAQPQTNIEGWYLKIATDAESLANSGASPMARLSLLLPQL